MYNPKHFQEQETAKLCDFLRAHPLGLLISGGGETLAADLVPFFLDSSKGLLRAHVSKANPQWQILTEQPPVLIVFQGPQGYVTPNWYAAKHVDGKVVPTWNYSTVQVRGTACVVHDPEWLHRHVRELTDFFEDARHAPWAVSDAPEAYVRGQIKGIVGLEITIQSLDGKMKLNQNRTQQDRAGVIAGLHSEGNVKLASLMRSTGI